MGFMKRQDKLVFRLANEKTQDDFSIWQKWGDKHEKTSEMKFPIKTGTLVSEVDGSKHDAKDLQFMKTPEFNRLFEHLQRNYRTIRDIEVNGIISQYRFPRSVEKQMLDILNVLKQTNQDVFKTYFLLEYRVDEVPAQKYLLEICKAPEAEKAPEVVTEEEVVDEPKSDETTGETKGVPLIKSLGGADKTIKTVILTPEELAVYDAVKGLRKPLSSITLGDFEATFNEQGFKDKVRIADIWQKYQDDEDVEK